MAARREPHISDKLGKRRLDRIQAARARESEKAEEREERGLWANLPTNLQDGQGRVRARAIAAQIMGVSDRYVGDAMRVQRESPELFEKIWNGQITVNAAIRLLDGVTETESARQTRTLRRELNILFRDPDPRFLERLEQVVAEFRDAG